MMGVIGIDADRQRLAVVRCVGRVREWLTIERMDRRDQIPETYSHALQVLMAQAQNECVVFLEDLPAKKYRESEMDTYRVLANVQGEILYEAKRHGVDVRRVPPIEWQMQVLRFCKDREKIKAASAVEARKMLNCWGLTEHESDAACICLYGLWVLRNEENVA